MPQSQDAAAAALPDDIVERVLDVVRQLARETGGVRAARAVAAQASLERDVGLGSLERVELLARLERAFGRPLDDASLAVDTAAGLARAVIEAMRGQPSDFMRTPKYGIERAKDDWLHKKYHQSLPIQPLIEVALGVYFTGTVVYAAANGIYGTLPFLVLFQFGFLYTGLMSILQQLGGDAIVVVRNEAMRQ